MKKLLVFFAVFGMATTALATENLSQPSSVQSHVDQLIDEEVLEPAPKGEFRSSVLKKKRLSHPKHGWYIGCFSRDYYGNIFPNYGYNAYNTAGRAYATCRVYSGVPTTCHHLGCGVYYY